MESYTDLDLHVQFVCFFRNDRYCVGRSNDQKYILPTSKLMGNLSYWILSLAKTVFNLFFFIVNFNNLKSEKKDYWN